MLDLLTLAFNLPQFNVLEEDIEVLENHAWRFPPEEALGQAHLCTVNPGLSG